MSDRLYEDLLAAVEQQLASPATAYVAKTLERLRARGLEEDAAKEQIALCLGEAMDEMLRRRRPFDEAGYRAALAELPFPEEKDGGEEE